MPAGDTGARGAPAWLGVCAALAAGSVVAWVVPAALLDWQPGRAWAEPWRFVTAAWVHWSPGHLGANLAAVAVTAALGHVAALPAPAAWTWLLAWPATHAALLAQPALAHYGGASGVLHAAVAVAACWLMAEGRSRTRAIGVAIAIGLLAKVLLERPWRGPLANVAGWDIAVAPLAHAGGAAAGVAAAMAVQAMLVLRRRARRHRQSPHG